jgi:SAM-dependent methyltransferase
MSVEKKRGRELDVSSNLNKISNRDEYRRIFENFYEREDPWGVRTNLREQYRYFVALKLISDRKYNYILDVGCGEGHFTNKLIKLGTKIVGVDISETAIRRAKKLYGNNITFIRGDICEIQMPEEFFDLIVCLEVLYYLSAKDVLKILKLFYKILKQGGRLLVSVRVGGGVSLTGTPYFNYNWLIRIINKRFKIVNTIPISAILPTKGKVLFNICFLLTPLIPKFFASHIIILAEKT